VTLLPGRRYQELITDDNTLLENPFMGPTRRCLTCRQRCGRRPSMAVRKHQ
jgi:hypothetical protein